MIPWADGVQRGVTRSCFPQITQLPGAKYASGLGKQSHGDLFVTQSSPLGGQKYPLK